MSKKKNSKRIYLSNKYVCKFICEEWLFEGKSLREYGRLYGVNYHIIEKIIEKNGYNIPLSTLTTMCFNKGIKLSQFFKLVESKYGDKLNDSFILE